MEYRHVMSVALLEGLTRLARKGCPTNLKYLELTRNQWDNFQKLRYWDLVEQAVDEQGRRKGGVWRITKGGLWFLMALQAIPKRVWTYRGERIRYDGNLIYARDVITGYVFRDEYAAEAQPHGAMQGDLYG